MPGFDENAKIKLLQTLKDKAEIIICVYAGDIERNKIRGDFGITYDMDVLRLIDQLRDYGLKVNSVVITRYDNQPATTVFIKKLERRTLKFIHTKPLKAIRQMLMPSSVMKATAATRISKQQAQSLLLQHRALVVASLQLV